MFEFVTVWVGCGLSAICRNLCAPDVTTRKAPDEKRRKGPWSNDLVTKPNQQPVFGFKVTRIWSMTFCFHRPAAAGRTGDSASSTANRISRETERRGIKGQVIHQMDEMKRRKMILIVCVFYWLSYSERVCVWLGCHGDRFALPIETWLNVDSLVNIQQAFNQWQHQGLLIFSSSFINGLKTAGYSSSILVCKWRVVDF